MAKSESVWIRNNYNGAILCRKADPTGMNEGQAFTFPRREVSVLNNQVVHSGVTEMTSEDFADLKKGSTIFAKFIEDGQLEVLDEVPIEDLGVAEQLAALAKENAELKAQLAKKGKKED